MLNMELIQKLLMDAVMLSTITCAFIQKTKGMFKSSKWINFYSFVVNVLFGVFFSQSFTELSIVNGLWIGLFSFIGADSLYKSLEGKLLSYKDIVKKKEEIVVIDRGE